MAERRSIFESRVATVSNLVTLNRIQQHLLFVIKNEFKKPLTENANVMFSLIIGNRPLSTFSLFLELYQTYF